VGALLALTLGVCGRLVHIATASSVFTEKDIPACRAVPDKKAWQLQTRTSPTENFTPYLTCKTEGELKTDLKTLCEVRGAGNVQYREYNETVWRDGCSAPPQCPPASSAPPTPHN
jgi:hypothetical protein